MVCGGLTGSEKVHHTDELLLLPHLPDVVVMSHVITGVMETEMATLPPTL